MTLSNLFDYALSNLTPANLPESGAIPLKFQTTRCISIFLLSVAISIAPNSIAIGQEKQSSAKNASSEVVESQAPVKAESPAYRGLDASLYMQTSAEYRALCLQTFRVARSLVEAKLSQTNQSTIESTSLPPAVVLDLDETVLDNGLFQSRQIRDKVQFDLGRWTAWENGEPESIRLVPGAKAFVERLKELGVAPIYITNRNNRCRKQTLDALARLGVVVPDDQLLMADEATGSNKTSRRASVTQRFNVLLYVGDNLRDFDERFRYDKSTGIEGRYAAVEELEAKFGIDWILLPNPAYGEWNKAFSNSEKDAELLYRD